MKKSGFIKFIKKLSFAQKTGLLTLLIILVSIPVALFLSGNITLLDPKASIGPDAHTNNFIIFSAEQYPNDIHFNLALNTKGNKVDGAQFTAYLNYEDPTILNTADSEFFVPNSNLSSQFNVVTNSITHEPRSKRYKLSFSLISKNPSQPIITAQPAPIAGFNIPLINPVSDSSNITIEFDNTKTKMINNITGENLAVNQAPYYFLITPPDPVTPPSTPKPTTSVSWITDTGDVELYADNFYIEVGGQRFTSQNSNISLHSNPDTRDYTTLEATWFENNQEMRLYMYFYTDGDKWWSDEFRTYNTDAYPDWEFFKNQAPYFTSPIGSEFSSPEIMLTSDNGAAKVYFENLRLKGFANRSNPIPTPTPKPTPTPTPRPDLSRASISFRYEGFASLAVGQKPPTTQFTIYDTNTQKIIKPYTESYSGSSDGSLSYTFTVPTLETMNLAIVINGEKHHQQVVRMIIDPNQPSQGTIIQAPIPVGDITGDHIIDIEDYHQLAIQFDPVTMQINASADLNYDGKVDIEDYMYIAKNFNPDYSSYFEPSFNYLYQAR